LHGNYVATSFVCFRVISWQNKYLPKANICVDLCVSVAYFFSAYSADSARP